MSYPYPQDRSRDRKEKGEQPYKDAKEAMSQERAQLQEEAEEVGERIALSHEERELDAQERLARINREVAEEHGVS
jgi:hypothetical protein